MNLKLQYPQENLLTQQIHFINEIKYNFYSKRYLYNFNGCCTCWFTGMANTLYIHVSYAFFLHYKWILLKRKYFNDSITFFKKRVKNLYFPYIKWSLIFLILHNFLFKLHFYDKEYGYVNRVDFSYIPQHLYNVNDYFTHAISILTKMEGHEQILGGYWFLRELFFGSIIGYIICKLIYNKYSIIKPSGICLVVCFFVKILNIHFPYIGLNWITMLAAFYYCLGYDMKYYNVKFWYTQKIIFILIVVIAITSYFLPEFEMGQQNLKNIIFYIIASIAGFFLVMWLSQYINSHNNKFKSFLIYTGNNTLSILTWHFVCFKVVSLLIVLLNNESLNRIAEFPQMRFYAEKGWWIGYAVIGIVLPLILKHK